MNKKKILLLIFFLFIFIGIAFVYLYHSGSKEIVTLSQKNTDIKRKPKDPGGLTMPNSDSLIYDNLRKNNSSNYNVRIISTSEEPIKLERKNHMPAEFLDSIDKILLNIEQYANSSNLDLSNNNSDIDDKSKLQITYNSGERYTNKASNSRATSEESGYKIQLAVAYSAEEIEPRWKVIKSKHKILADSNLITKKVKGKNERIFYLIMAGNYPSLSQAKIICRKLSSAKQNCIITK
ncbi:SPOR domain-containing protein [Rickettsiaceae bacterium]|nr:SPOR domain-containing protein [Rickettsiaceae bacterium]